VKFLRKTISALACLSLLLVLCQVTPALGVSILTFGDDANSGLSTLTSEELVGFEQDLDAILTFTLLDDTHLELKVDNLTSRTLSWAISNIYLNFTSNINPDLNLDSFT